MKFLAMLKDSIREAFDAKVIYVMFAMSVILALLALSVSYAPDDSAGNLISDYAILGLNADVSDLDSAREIQALFRLRPVQFTLDSAEAFPNERPAPDGRLRVKLTAHFNTAEAAKALDHPDEIVAFVREHFGLIEGRHMLEAEDVTVTPNKPGLFNLNPLNALTGAREATVELTTKPTATTVRFWPHRVAVFFGLLPFGTFAVPLFQQLLFIENGLVGYIGSTIAVLVSLVLTAFFIPNMLRKGTVDMLIVKPISRPALLLYKFVGGLTFIFVNTTVAVGGVWLAIGIRSGVWAPAFLLTIGVLTFFFAILYSVSAFFGVLTRNPIAAILLTCMVWVFLFAVNFAHYTVLENIRAISRAQNELKEKLGPEGMRALQSGAKGGDVKQPDDQEGPKPLPDLHFEENWFTRTVSFLASVLPRTNDLYAMNERRLRHDLAFGEFTPPPKEEAPPQQLPGGFTLPKFRPDPPGLFEILWVSSAFMAFFLGLSCLWFATKDY